MMQRVKVKNLEMLLQHTGRPSAGPTRNTAPRESETSAEPGGRATAGGSMERGLKRRAAASRAQYGSAEAAAEGHQEAEQQPEEEAL